VGIISGVGKAMYPNTLPNEVLGQVLMITLPKWASVLFLIAVLSAELKS
jgi:hypothetical protein